MDNQLVWSNEYNLGVEIIDKEHQRLFKIINKLFAFGEEEKKNQRTCQEGIKYFKGHTVKHFADEESYMASINYEGLERHIHIHRGFRENTPPALEQELEQSGYSPEAVDHFLGVCTGWLIGHTLTEDQAIVGRHQSKWDDLLPENELKSIKKLIIQLIFDLFHLESQVISDTYSGEKFGKGVYYRLVCRSKDDEEKRQEIILVFEEKLLINTVGKIMGVQTNRMDSMLIHAARYTARQFVGRVLEHLPGGKFCEPEEENLMTYEQFQEVFTQEKPQVSLLFNTGAGYFAYCAIAPNMLQGGHLTPIENQNAIKEVEKYLSERKHQAEQEEAAHKKKILLVDDSLTIRQGMKQLLENDYDVSLADSGASAFRAITLEQPDLVLLDYEMPVCDGRQTLEMLRTVKEFDHIPVIFLTGKRDPESMIKVMPLNPAGYFLKHLKPQEIKKKIDDFFEGNKS